MTPTGLALLDLFAPRTKLTRPTALLELMGPAEVRPATSASVMKTQTVLARKRLRLVLTRARLVLMLLPLIHVSPRAPGETRDRAMAEKREVCEASRV